MSSLLNNPAIQTAAAPFIVALLIALILRPLGRYRSGVAVMAGMLTTLALAIGFQFSPLTSTRKIVLTALILIPLAAALTVPKLSWRMLAPVLAVLAAGVTLWVIWPVLGRQEGSGYWIMLLASIAYSGWLAAGLDRLHTSPEPALPAALTLALGTGMAALLGASAILGQMAMAMGAATGAVALVHLFTTREPAERLLTVPVAVLSGVLGVAATIYAKVPWFALLPLAIIPALGYLPLPVRFGDRVKLVVYGLIMLVAMIVAVVLTWYSAGGLAV